MSNVLSKLLRKPCLHEQTIVVRSTHVERIVCETCGYLSFTMSPSGVSASKAQLIGTAASSGMVK